MARPKKKEFAACHPTEKYCAKDMCRKCYTAENMRKWRAAHPEHKEKDRARNTSAPVKARRAELSKTWNSRFRRTPGWSEILVTQRMQEQNGRCAVCCVELVIEGPNCAKRLHKDHDHKTNRARGLLCLSCNVRLGYYEQFVESGLLKKFEDYLKKHESPSLTEQGMEAIIKDS